MKMIPVEPAESNKLSDDLSTIDSLAPNPTTLNDSVNTPDPVVKTQQRTRKRSSAINKNV
ncbi:MAG: hypothetical protein ACOYK1_08405 [Vampirovibrionia bacterium]